MKNKLRQLVALTTLAFGLVSALADEKPDQIVGGPKGGRLLDTEPKAEFFVQKDRKVAITFYDKDLKPVAPKDQVVTVIAQPKSGKTELKLEKQGDSLVSNAAMPEGDGYNVIIQVRSTAQAKPKNFRLTYDEYVCGGCKRAEYACTCGH